MYQTYKKHAEFLFVYIREAHPGSVLNVVKDGKKQLKKIDQTDTLKDRTETAKLTVETLKLTMPTVVDKADNKVNVNYAGWPDRFYIIGVDGRVAYMGGPGPRGFRPLEVEKWLKENVAKNSKGRK